MTTAFVTGGSEFLGRRLIGDLRSRGDAVVGLASSDQAAREIERAGGEAVGGDLGDPGGLRDAMRGADVVFHTASKSDEWGRPAEFERINVEGANNVLWAMRHAGVPRIVHVSTAFVLAGGRPVVQADETREPPRRPLGWFARSMLDAERAVLASTAEGIEAMVVRPALLWGPGDTTWLPRLAASVGTGRFRWVGGGRHVVSTTHVANAVHGTMLAADRGRPGGIYFVTDGPPVRFHELATRLLGTRGLTPPERGVSARGARVSAVMSESVWSLFNAKNPPALTRTSLAATGAELTVSDVRARDQLGYEPLVDLETGIEELARRRRGRAEA